MEHRPKIIMIMITIIMGHECVWGTVWGGQREAEAEKERILKGEEDGRILCIYIARQQNETIKL
jgi:hypothetical protein